MRAVWLSLLLIGAGCAASPAPAPEPRARTARDGSRLVWIPPGEYQRGSPGGADEGPEHRVTLTDGVWLGEREVTWAQFRRFCQASGREPPAPAFPVTGAHPVHNVTWDEAAAYCAWAGGRLPTEAEWEWAASGGDDRRFPWGDEPTPGLANWAGEADGFTQSAPVGSLPRDRSPFGCLDMAGNVREWVADRYGPYAAQPQVDPTGPAQGALRVARGGGWGSPPRRGRCSNRKRRAPGKRHPVFGFRLAVDP